MARGWLTVRSFLLRQLSRLSSSQVRSFLLRLSHFGRYLIKHCAQRDVLTVHDSLLTSVIEGIPIPVHATKSDAEDLHGSRIDVQRKIPTSQCDRLGWGATA